MKMNQDAFNWGVEEVLALRPIRRFLGSAVSGAHKGVYTSTAEAGKTYGSAYRGKNQKPMHVDLHGNKQ